VSMDTKRNYSCDHSINISIYYSISF